MTESSSAKTYSLVVVVFILASIVALYMLATQYWPAYTFAKARQTIAQDENARSKKALADSVSFLETYNRETSNASTINLALPKKDADMANFVSSISQLAVQSGMSLLNLVVNVSLDERVDENSIKSEDLTLTTTGTYLSFLDFMSKLETNLRIIDVYNITLATSGTTGPGTPPLVFTMKLHTYYQQ